MDSGFPPNKSHVSVTSYQEGVFKSSSGDPAHTILFCLGCKKKFFDGKVETEDQILSFTASEQVALSHGRDLGHPIFGVIPEREL